MTGTPDVIAFIDATANAKVIRSIVSEVRATRDVACVQLIDPAVGAREYEMFLRKAGLSSSLLPSDVPWVLKVALSSRLRGNERPARATQIAALLSSLTPVERVSVSSKEHLPESILPAGCSSK